MVNALLDFGDDGGVSGFAGGGVGLARVKMRADLEPFAGGFSGTDRSFAWQLLAGVRTAISDNVDLGLKYRFFNTKFDFEGDTLQGGASQLDGRFRSHSLLASLIFNFGAPAAPPPAPPTPPPPPLPPATQTCPDGSVILATDNCPLPPPPPPPPAAPERG